MYTCSTAHHLLHTTLFNTGAAVALACLGRVLLMPSYSSSSILT
jgi:hypothetical protein